MYGILRPSERRRATSICRFVSPYTVLRLDANKMLASALERERRLLSTFFIGRRRSPLSIALSSVLIIFCPKDENDVIDMMTKANIVANAIRDHSSDPEETSLLMKLERGQASADAASIGPYAIPRVKNGEAPRSLETIAA